jgi:hypothetical protein
MIGRQHVPTVRVEVCVDFGAWPADLDGMGGQIVSVAMPSTVGRPPSRSARCRSANGEVGASTVAKAADTWC